MVDWNEYNKHNKTYPFFILAILDDQDEWFSGETFFVLLKQKYRIPIASNQW